MGPTSLLDSTAPSTSAVSKGKRPQRLLSRKRSLNLQEGSEASTSQTRVFSPQEEAVRSTFRKRSLSPQAGASNPRKRPRIPIMNERNIGTATKSGRSEEVPESNVASGSKSCFPVTFAQSPESARPVASLVPDLHTTSYSSQEHRSSSPLHRPLTYFDPEADADEGKVRISFPSTQLSTHSNRGFSKLARRSHLGIVQLGKSSSKPMCLT